VVRTRFELGEPGFGFVFADLTGGGSAPKAYVPTIAKALEEQRQSGVIGGDPTVDFKATLLDGDFHVVDTSALAFAIAARACFRKAMKLASPVLLEPVMKIVTRSPDEAVGSGTGEIVRRRGRVTGQRRKGAHVVLEADIPLAATFGYVGAIRSLSAVRASTSKVPGGYAEAPRQVREARGGVSRLGRACAARPVIRRAGGNCLMRALREGGTHVPYLSLRPV
jgi:elongation factor G